MVIFPLEQVPEMARGAGVRLQRYKDGGLSDVKTFKAADGLTWIDGGRAHLHADAEGARRLARQPRRCRPAARRRASREATSSVDSERAG